MRPTLAEERFRDVEKGCHGAGILRRGEGN